MSNIFIGGTGADPLGFDSIRERYGTVYDPNDPNTFGSLDDPNNPKTRARGSSDWFATDLNKLTDMVLSGEISYNTSTNKFDIPNQYRVIAGVTDADLARSVLVKRQKQRKAQIQEATGLSPKELGINTGTSSLEATKLLKREDSLQKGQNWLTEQGLTVADLNLVEGGRQFDPEKRYTTKDLAPAVTALRKQEKAEEEKPKLKIEADRVKNEEDRVTETVRTNKVQEAIAREKQKDSRQASNRDHAWRQWKHSEDQKQRNHELKIARLEKEDNRDFQMQQLLMDKEQKMLDRQYNRERDARAERKDEKATRQQMIMMMMKGLANLGTGFSI